MQFDPGMEYRPSDYRAAGFGIGNKLQQPGNMMGGMPPGMIPPGGGNMDPRMGGIHQRTGNSVPGILPPPSQQVQLHNSQTILCEQNYIPLNILSVRCTSNILT